MIRSTAPPSVAMLRSDHSVGDNSVGDGVAYSTLHTWPNPEITSRMGQRFIKEIAVHAQQQPSADRSRLRHTRLFRIATGAKDTQAGHNDLSL